MTIQGELRLNEDKLDKRSSIFIILTRGKTSYQAMMLINTSTNIVDQFKYFKDYKSIEPSKGRHPVLKALRKLTTDLTKPALETAYAYLEHDQGLTPNTYDVKISALGAQFRAQVAKINKENETMPKVKPVAPAVVVQTPVAPATSTVQTPKPALPTLPPATTAPAVTPAIQVKETSDLASIAKGTQNTMEKGRVSTALKKAYTDENNAMAAYTMLGSRFEWGVPQIIKALASENLWPLNPKGKPVGYKKVYTQEKDMGITSWGHFVNRCSERFTMLNPANIEKREQQKVEADKKKQEAAAQAAKDLANKVKKPASKVSQGFDIGQLEGDEIMELAKLCIMALDEDQADLLASDAEIKAKFKYDGE